MTTKQAAPESTAPATPAPVDEGTLAKALTEATANFNKAMDEVKAASQANDMKAMLTAMDTAKAAQRVMEKADAALKAATWEKRNAERLAFSETLKKAAEDFITKFAEQATGLGLKGLHIVFDPESPKNPTVSVSADKPVVTKSKSRGANSGESKGRANVLYNGNIYTASEFLEQFGGEAGAEAIDKARNYKNYGLKFSPGFDQPKRKLMKELGATFEDGSQP